MKEQACQLPPEVEEALAVSFLGQLPRDLVRPLLVSGARLETPAGSILYREGDEIGVCLVLDGLFRMFIRSTTGREVTIRYTRCGDALGVVGLAGGPANLGVQALTAGAVWILNVETFLALARSDPRLGWAVAEECAGRLYDLLDELAGNTFAPVRERVARHLLDLVAGHQQRDELVAPVSQNELANAVGSVREVVARVLRGLRAEKIVEISHAGIVVTDAARLYANSWTDRR